MAVKKKTKITIISLIIIMLLVIISLIAICLTDCYGMVGSKEEKAVFISEGESVSDVLIKLENEKIILNRNIFKIYLKISGETPKISYGEHILTSDMSYSEILKALSNYSYKETISVRIPENSNLYIIASTLEKNGICSAEEFLKVCNGNDFTFSLKSYLSNSYKVAYKLEGYIYPDTYSFYKNDDPLRVLNVMLKRTETIFGDEEIKRANELGLTVNEVFTLASIIEGECCGKISEMPKVSAVFWNRLNDWGKETFLQSDVTGNYPFKTEYYNSYTNGGLPPGPINCITENSIKAALYPDETINAYFFVTDTDMNFYYNVTDAAHQQTIDRLKRENKWA